MGALASATKAASTKRKRKRSASANASWRPEQDRVLAATTAGQDWESVAQRVSSVGPAKTASACQMRHARQERRPGQYEVRCILQARRASPAPEDEVLAHEYLVRWAGHACRQPGFDEHGRRKLLASEFAQLLRDRPGEPPKPGDRVAIAFGGPRAMQLCCGQVLADGSVEPDATDYSDPDGDHGAQWDDIRWLPRDGADADDAAVWTLLTEPAQPGP